MEFPRVIVFIEITSTCKCRDVHVEWSNVCYSFTGLAVYSAIHSIILREMYGMPHAITTPHICSRIWGILVLKFKDFQLQELKKWSFRQDACRF